MNWNEYRNGRGVFLGNVRSGVVKEIENEKSHRRPRWKSVSLKYEGKVVTQIAYSLLIYLMAISQLQKPT
jgi:hypothetical protein